MNVGFPSEVLTPNASNNISLCCVTEGKFIVFEVMNRFVFGKAHLEY